MNLIFYSRKLFFVFILFSFSSCYHIKENPETLGIKSSSSLFLQKLIKGERVKIVTLGTSLTGGHWKWVNSFDEELFKFFPGKFRIINLGVGASASEYIPGIMHPHYHKNKCGIDRVKEAAKYKPDIVFIEFATNDSYIPYEISLKKSRDNLLYMINYLQTHTPDTEIVLQGMNAVLDCPEKNVFSATDRPSLEAYIQVYKDVALAFNLKFINYYNIWKNIILTDTQRFFRLVPDGIHPTEKAYSEIMIPVLMNALIDP
jgi:lysophospholipase L1-like esterase